MRIIDVYQTFERLYIVMEYCAGGSLHEVLENAGRLSENYAKHIIMDILKGVDHLHVEGIVHRDIKTENIICKNRDFPLHLKLADFGFSTSLHHQDGDLDSSAREDQLLLQSLVGSPYYIAPEVLRRQRYGRGVDIWACGVTLYRMLCGYYPFQVLDERGAVDRNLTLEMVVQGTPDFEGPAWRKVSPDGVRFTKALLSLDRHKRPSARKALRDPWLDSVRTNS
eukprot:CAMPEP_0184718338 /NCGR_PEP_ID=MMETSP0314-20130426/7564_1 /TAXON_ID=38298 /ORGANISM="Rhodella maculata, Strain CCMP 736" /LENGTH=223 /DNA_ID=CAMNT_0027182067 /DNA_START=46 /DNA_END=717 /DNA_ORIENTATION=+